MPVKSAEIEYDLDDFDVDEIIDHLEDEHITSDEAKRLLAILLKNKYLLTGAKLNELEIDDVEDYNPGWPAVISLADKFKQEAVVNAWEHLSQVEFERRLQV